MFEMFELPDESRPGVDAQANRGAADQGGETSNVKQPMFVL